jgi:hypothetical protein
MDSESKSMRQIAVDSYLEKPDQKVTSDREFPVASGWPHYAAETVLSIPGDKIEVRIEDSDYRKLAL